MDKSSINSLNSRRNFKLPPIQGALPATLYGDRSWNSNNKPPLSPHGSLQPHVRIKRESIPSRDFHSLHRATLQTRTDPFPKKTTFPSSRQHTTVEINLGHEFPKSYSVLPPISKDTPSKDNGNSCLLSATKINPVKKEPRTTTDKKYSTASKLLSERRRERLLEKQKAQNGVDQGQCGATTESHQIIKEIEPRKTSKTEEVKEIVNRKPSATYLLYLKSKRNYRRGGVCPENESSLINVTEQLKEIFLRRNMEEMYLI